MALVSLTASHHEIDLDSLARLATGAPSMAGSVVAASELVTGAVVLATCNRLELYLDVDLHPGGPPVPQVAAQAARVVAAASGIDVATAEAALRTRTGSEVAEHLFAVAAGLDSMVVGEREIAGQVRRALEAARDYRLTTSSLELLFQSALRTSKRVAAHTTLGDVGRGVVSFALDLAEAGLPSWHDVRALVIGTGSYAGASLAALRARGCGDIAVHSRSGRAVQFAAARGVAVAADLATALTGADLVVSCSGRRPAAAPGDAAGPSSEYVLDAASVARSLDRATAPLRAGPLVVLDLALHRDVAPGVADLDGAVLLDLATLAARSPAVASDVVDRARAIVADGARTYEETAWGRAADAVVVELQRDAQRRVEAQVREAVAAHRAAGDEPSDAQVSALTHGVRRRVRAELHRAILAARAEVLDATLAVGIARH